MNKKQKMLVSLVKESQKHDIKYGYCIISFKEALYGWRHDLKEDGKYNLEYMRSARDFIKRDNQ